MAERGSSGLGQPKHATGTLETVSVLERDAVLAGLDQLLGEAAAGRGHLVLLRGEAGIGKTTVVDAFTSGRSGRLLWGTCDPVMPPRPLAPIADIAAQVGGDLHSALERSDRHRVMSALLGLLRADGGPWIMVVEDLQWGDDATFELLQVVGRRIAQLPALVVATARDDELGPDHPMTDTLGDIPAASTVSIALPPLSVAAVAELARDTAIDPVALHRAAAGNPFFVTEVIAAGGPRLPASVRDAVRARVRRLGPSARDVLSAAAVLGPRCDTDVLIAVGDAALDDVDHCVARAMLRRDGATVEFRHELSRQAVLESLTPSARVRLHGRALAVVRDRSGIDFAELVYHAVEAGDGDAVLEWAPRAGAQAAGLGAHRLARLHYQSALPYAGRLAERDRAVLLEAHAYEAQVTDDVERAIASQQEALECWRAVGDSVGEGRGLTQLADSLWWKGEGERAIEAVTRAIALLEAGPADVELGYAYARIGLGGPRLPL
jgi:predicted ATPase